MLSYHCVNAVTSKIDYGTTSERDVESASVISDISVGSNTKIQTFINIMSTLTIDIVSTLKHS